MSSFLSDLNWLDEFTRAEMARWGVPGVAIGVFLNGEVRTAGYGTVNVETGYPVLPETIFQTGSISKTFTATLVLQLVDEGILDLDAPVVAYVPELPLADETARRSITLRHLLTHTAGFFGERYDDHGPGDDALARAVGAFSTLPQQAPPGEVWAYASAGFDLAARAIELALGQRFEWAMRDRVFRPLGFDRATYFASEAILHSVAVGHSSNDATTIRRTDRWSIPRRTSAAGGVVTNVSELLLWARLHMDGGELDGVRILRAQTAAMMLAGQTDGAHGFTQAIAWQRRTIDGLEMIGHDGGTIGQKASLWIAPDRRFAIAVLTNSQTGDALHVAVRAAVLDRLLGVTTPKQEIVELPISDLEALAGAYRAHDTELRLATAGNGFDAVVRSWDDRGGWTAGESMRLLPIHSRAFAIQGSTASEIVDFVFHPNGDVRFLRFRGRLATRANYER